MPSCRPFSPPLTRNLPRVLEVVAIDHLSQDALGRNGRAVRGHHQGDFALRHDRHRHFDDPVLPAPVAEMQSRRERVGLITRPRRPSAINWPGAQRAAGEPLDDDAHLPLADQHQVRADNGANNSNSAQTAMANPIKVDRFNNTQGNDSRHTNPLRCGCDHGHGCSPRHGATRFCTGRTWVPRHADLEDRPSNCRRG